MPKYRRFSDASVSEKILDSIFLVTIGLGYLFALLNMYYTYEGRDGKPGLSVEDVKIAYYGSHNQSRLGAAINGAMAVNIKSSADKTDILDWLQRGAKEEEYNTKVKPILDNSCTGCHSPASGINIPPLTSYEEVIKMTKTDTGASIPALVRVSHIHLFGIAFILFFVGRIFLLCEIPKWVKRTTVGVPFLFLIGDILSWYLSKIIPGFAYAVVVAGALMGLSFAAQILLSLYQMWFFKQKGTSEI